MAKSKGATVFVHGASTGTISYAFRGIADDF
jgi:hypothetical protein